MKVLKIIGWVILSLIVLVLLLGLIMPKDYDISREIVISAPKGVIFKQVGSLRAMDAWSPWSKMDPNIEQTFEGEDGAIGSMQSWSGNKDVGKGSNTITASEPGSRVETKVNFLEPFESEAGTYIQLDDAEGGTKVTWGMKGTMPFPWNALSPLMGMTGAIEKDYDKGLAALKTLVEEKVANPTYRGYTIQTVDLPARTYIGFRAKVGFNDMGAYFQKHMPAIFKAALGAGAVQAGAPAGLFYEWNMETNIADMAVAIPVAAQVLIKGGSVEDLPAGKAVVVDYYGAYEGTGEAHFAIDDYLKEFGLAASAPVIEEYITDPMTEPDTTKWLTKIIYPLK